MLLSNNLQTFHVQTRYKCEAYFLHRLITKFYGMQDFYYCSMDSCTRPLLFWWSQNEEKNKLVQQCICSSMIDAGFVNLSL